jgi:hypothetical protein
VESQAIIHLSVRRVDSGNNAKAGASTAQSDSSGHGRGK